MQRAHQLIMAIVLVLDQRSHTVDLQHPLQAAEGVVFKLAPLLVIEHVAEFVVVERLLCGVILKQAMGHFGQLEAAIRRVGKVGSVAGAIGELGYAAGEVVSFVESELLQTDRPPFGIARQCLAVTAMFEEAIELIVLESLFAHLFASAVQGTARKQVVVQPGQVDYLLFAAIDAQCAGNLAAQRVVGQRALHLAIGIVAVAGGGGGEQAFAVVAEGTVQAALVHAGDAPEAVIGIVAVVTIGVLAGLDSPLQRVPVGVVMLLLVGDFPGFCAQVTLSGVVVFAATAGIGGTGNLCAHRVVGIIGLQFAAGRALTLHFDPGADVGRLHGQLRQVLVADHPLAQALASALEAVARALLHQRGGAAVIVFF